MVEVTPVAWVVRYNVDSVQHELAYIHENDARRAASNVERYCFASNVRVIAAHARED